MIMIMIMDKIPVEQSTGIALQSVAANLLMYAIAAKQQIVESTV